MKRILAICVALTVVLTITVLRGEEKRAKQQQLASDIIPRPLKAAPSSQAGKTNSVPKLAPQAPVDPAMVNEITRLRSQFGNPLKGTVLDSGDSAAFAKSLQRVIRELPPVLKPTGGHVVDQNAVTSDAAASQPLVTQPQVPVVARSIAAPRTLVVSLRQSARLLDSRANDLEDRDEFQEADRLRTLASGLRAEARTLRSVQTTRRLPPSTKVQRYE